MNLYFFVNGALSFPFVPFVRSNRESFIFCFSPAKVVTVFLYSILSRLWLLLSFVLSQRVSDVNSDSPVDTSTLFRHELSYKSSVCTPELFFSVIRSICFNLMISFSSFCVIWVSLSISSLCLQKSSVLHLTS